MKLESRTVFIDTQSFVKMGLNFNHPALQSLLKLCNQKKLYHITTTVVKKEVVSKINESIHEALCSMQQFRRRARILENIDDTTIRLLFNKLDDEEIYRRALLVYESFLSDSLSRIVDASSVNVELILESYFSRKPPFGDGKKKSEFPDAISLQSLLNETNGNKIYVISEDPDIKGACTLTERLICVDTLDKFLDIYNEHENKITEIVKAYVKSIDAYLKHEISEAINDTWAYNEAPWEDSEVDEFRVLEVHEIDPSVVWVNEEECLVTFDVDVDLEYTVTGPDFNNSIYDREDKRVYAFWTTSRSATSTKTFTVEVGLSYELVNGKLHNIDETEFHVCGLSDGVAIYLDENGDTW